MFDIFHCYPSLLTRNVFVQVHIITASAAVIARVAASANEQTIIISKPVFPLKLFRAQPLNPTQINQQNEKFVNFRGEEIISSETSRNHIRYFYKYINIANIFDFL